MSGSKSIGEPEWKPHYCNVETNPCATTVYHRDGDLEKQKWSFLKEEDKLLDDSQRKEEIFHNNTKAKSESVHPEKIEWTYYSDGSKHGKRCVIDGNYIGNQETMDEVQLEKVVGTRQKVVDRRGALPCMTKGDKSYAVPEFSADFHKEGCTLPAVNFSRISELVTDTFIPLQQLPRQPSATYLEKEKERKLLEEKEEVTQLDNWIPAKPLTSPFQ